MSDFEARLKTICSAVEGAVAATLMGVDGIPIQAYQVEPQGAPPSEGELDVQSLLIEYSSLLAQVQRSAQMFAAGGLEELSITSERLAMIIRPVTPEYFVALALRSTSPGGVGANFGKGRYLLRIHGPQLAAELA